MIDMASVYAERYKTQPQMLQAAVMGQSPDPKLDPYTALNALKLVKESQRMIMAGQAQQPTSSPSIVAETMAPNPMQQGLGAMVPGAMGQAPQGQAPAPQAPVMQASGGLAGMYTPEEDFAEGGIVAFQSGGRTGFANAAADDPTLRLGGEGESGDGQDDDYLALLDELEGGEGSPAGLAAANKLALATARRIAGRDLRDLTPEEARTLYETEYAKITKAAGPNPYAALRADLAEQDKERTGNLEFDKGTALLEAASAVLEGNNTMRGLAKGGAQFARSYGAALRADKAAKRSMAQMEFHIADAERKERMGNSRAAAAAVESARKDRAAINKAELDRDVALGRLSTEMGKFNKPARAAGAGGDKLLKVNEQLAAAEIAFETDPSDANKNRVAALRRTVDRIRTSESGPGKIGAQTAAITSKENIAAEQALTKHKLLNKRDWKKAVEAAGSETAAEEQYKKKWITANPQTADEDGAPAPKPTAAPKPAATTKVATMADVDATAKASKKTRQEVMDALEAKGYTIK